MTGNMAAVTGDCDGVTRNDDGSDVLIQEGILGGNRRFTILRSLLEAFAPKCDLIIMR